MKTAAIPHFVVLALLLLGFVVISLGAVVAESKPSLLAKFKDGQSFVVIEKEGRYEIRSIAEAAGGTHKVIEIGSDFLLLRDVSEQIDLAIPIYSIKSVVTLRSVKQEMD